MDKIEDNYWKPREDGKDIEVNGDILIGSLMKAKLKLSIILEQLARENSSDQMQKGRWRLEYQDISMYHEFKNG